MTEEKLDKCLDSTVTFPKFLMDDIIEAIPHTQLARLEKYRKGVLKSATALDFKEIFDMSALDCPAEGCEIGFKEPFSFASGAPIQLFSTFEHGQSYIGARFVASKELFEGFAAKPSIKDPNEKKAYDVLYAGHVNDGKYSRYSAYMGFPNPEGTANFLCKVYGSKTAKKLKADQYTLMHLDYIGRYYDEKGVCFLSVVMTQAEELAMLTKHFGDTSKDGERYKENRFQLLKNDIRRCMRTMIGLEVTARIASLVSKRISACKKQIKETPELQEQLKSELMVNKTNKALETLTTLNELKQAIDAVVSGISKDTLSKHSVSALERSIYSARSDLRTIVRDLNKYYIKELPSYLKDEK